MFNAFVAGDSSGGNLFRRNETFHAHHASNFQVGVKWIANISVWMLKSRDGIQFGL